ncbi:hypothetical protein D3C76_1738610 [compost metagenome]
MAQRRIALDLGTAIALQALGAMLGTAPGGLAVERQQLEKVAETLLVIVHVRWKLPKDRPELVAQQ